MNQNQEIECSICYETLSNVNNCVTPCGHVFCFKCIAQSMKNNETCPCCRSEFYEKPVVTEGDEDEDDDDDYSYNPDEDDEDMDNEGPFADIEVIAERFAAKGYTLVDAFVILFKTFKSRDPKYTDEYVEKLDEYLDDLIVETDNEVKERTQFREQDVNVLNITADNSSANAK